MRVNIIGDNLEGLLAAHAADQAGAQVRLFAAPPLEQPLHAPLFVENDVEGIDLEPRTIYVQLTGSVLDYMVKAGVVSTTLGIEQDYHIGSVLAWETEELREHLLDRYGELIAPRFRSVDDLPASDLNINAAQAWVICNSDSCQFTFQEYWEGDFSKYSNIKNDTVIASARPDDWWHTVSKIGGVERTWFPEGRKPGNTDLVTKFEVPNGTNCSCRPTFMRVGPRARWRAQVKVNDAYHAVVERMKHQ